MYSFSQNRFKTFIIPTILYYSMTRKVSRRKFATLVGGIGLTALAGCSGDNNNNNNTTTTSSTPTTDSTTTTTTTDENTTTQTTGEYFKMGENGWYVVIEGDCQACGLKIISSVEKYDQIRSNINKWKGTKFFIENVTVSPTQVDGGWYVLNEFNGKRGYFTKSLQAGFNESLSLVAEVTGTKTVQGKTGLTLDVVAELGAVPPSDDTPS